jgi:hypothetical protein
MPFVVQARIDYLPVSQKTYETKERRLVMNWIFEAYSNVYNAAMMNAAMMQDQSRPSHVASAKDSAVPKRFTLFKPSIRG